MSNMRSTGGYNIQVHRTVTGCKYGFDSSCTDLGRMAGCYANGNKPPVPIKMENLLSL